MRFLPTVLAACALSALSGVKAQYYETVETLEPADNYVVMAADDLDLEPEFVILAAADEALSAQPLEAGYGSAEALTASPDMMGAAEPLMGSSAGFEAEPVMGSSAGWSSGFEASPVMGHAASGASWPGFQAVSAGKGQQLQQPIQQFAAVTAPRTKMSAQPISLPAETLPVQRITLPDVKASEVRTTAPIMVRQKATQRASPIYTAPKVEVRVIERNLVQPVVMDQQIRQKHYIEQPILTRRVIEQPVIQPRVTQNLIRTRVTPQPIVRRHLVVQPVVQPRLIEQPHIKQRFVQTALVAKPLQETINAPANQPIVGPQSTSTAQAIVHQPIMENRAATSGYLNQPITSKKQ